MSSSSSYSDIINVAIHLSKALISSKWSISHLLKSRSSQAATNISHPVDQKIPKKNCLCVDKTRTVTTAKHELLNRFVHAWTRTHTSCHTHYHKLAHPSIVYTHSYTLVVMYIVTYHEGQITKGNNIRVPFSRKTTEPCSNPSFRTIFKYGQFVSCQIVDSYKLN